MTNYKYFINDFEVFPLNAGKQKVTYERRTESSATFEIVLQESLIFNAKGSFDFKAQEALDYTEELKLKIKKKCNGIFKDFVNLVFTVAEGEFDDDKCLFTVKARSLDAFQKDIPVNIINLESRVSLAGDYNAGVSVYPILSSQYKQSFYFDKVILLVAQKSNNKIKGIISDFFQINPITVSNYCLPDVYNFWKNMAFCALSDIQNPIPSNLATFEFITFAELMEDLNILFDVFWFIDEKNYLRIEHRLFFDGVQGLDLTQPKYDKHMVATTKYKYDLGDAPKTERLKIVGSSQYAQISYASGVTTINKNKSIVSKQTKKIRTDYSTLIDHGGSSSNDGLFLFACQYDSGYLQMYHTQPLIPANEENENFFDTQNIFLTPKYLLKKLHLYNKYDNAALFESGTIYTNYPQMLLNSGGIKTKSIAPTKLQNEISFPLCCDILDTKDQIKTKMGLGFLEKAELEMNTDIVKVQLKYKTKPLPFEPTDLPGLQLWLRHDRGLSTFYDSSILSYRVTQWNDYSGNGRHALATSGFEPHTGIINPILNGHRGVFFGSNNNNPIANPNGLSYLKTPAFQLFPNKRGTVFILGYFGYIFAGNSVVSVISNNDVTTATPSINSFDFSNINGINLSLNRVTKYPQHLFQSDIQLVQIKRDSDTTEFHTHNSVNVKQYTEDTFLNLYLYNPHTVPNVQFTSKPLVLGSNEFLSNSLNNGCSIYELLIYDHELTELECQKVELYLARIGIYKINTAA